MVLCFLTCSLFANVISARQLWIEPGTNPQPVIETLVAGDTLWVKAGVYDNIDDMINVRHSGTRYHRICVFGYGDGRAVFDFKNQPHTGDDNAGQYRDFTHAADNGMKLEASYCVIERCNFYRNGDTGLQLGFDKDGNGGNNRNQKFLYGRYNQIINCDSYYNYDVQSHGGNADGFANNCWAIWNGYLEDGSIGVNGNGFKQGGNKQGGGSYGAHIFMNCVAAYNLYHGFDQNNHNEGNWIINCTAFGNKQVNFRFNCDVEMLGGTVFHLRNCLGFRPGEANHRFGDMWPDSKATNWQDILGVSPQYNMGKGTNPETGQEYVRISAKDWPDYDDQFEDITLETAIGPRQPNGELPLGFARLKENSIFVDKGIEIKDLKCEDIFQEQYKLPGAWLDDYSTTVTLPFAGAAPDYGAYEQGMERPAYNTLEMLPVNDGTMFDVMEVNKIGEKWYKELKLIDDELFQTTVLNEETAKYITDASTQNSVNPTYYGKSGNKEQRKIGQLYGGGTLGAYKVAKSGGFIELTLPSLSMMRSDMYPAGDTTFKLEWHYADNTDSGDGETVSYDRRMHCFDFLAYGIPRSVKPIVVKLTNTGGQDLYLTDLLVSGFEETEEPEEQPITPVDGIADVKNSRDIFFTSNGIIAYGDVKEIMVYNAAGMLIKKSEKSQFCNLSDVGSGIYTVVICDNDSSTTVRKFLRH